MRIVNIAAALSGLVALGFLVAAAHLLHDVLQPPDLDRIRLGAFVQMGAACAGLAIANRSGRLNCIAGALILLGAASFAGALYGLSLTQNPVFGHFAPVGGIALIAGWLALAFTRPSQP